MAIVEMVMPKMGESIMEGTILKWLKQPGDTIEQDESVLEVATDKVDTEVPSTHAGVLKETLANEGDVIEVGKAIAIITTEGDGENEITVSEVESEEQSEPIQDSSLDTTTSVKSSPVISTNGHSSDRFYSPLVLNIARQENIAMTELEAVNGTGKDGRVTKKDILSYVDNRVDLQPETTKQPVQKKEKTTSTSNVSKPQRPATTISSVGGGDEIIEMDRMRKMIAERMVESKRIAPHVTSFVEADVSNLVAWRNRMKRVFLEKEGEKLTYTPMLIECVVKAIKDYPMINISVDGDAIIKKKAINIGMAVALPSGNLIVPVIKNADQLNLVGLTKQVNNLAVRARENKLTPDELSGGTFTISNVGSFGNVMGTPIILQPQVGIMALGAIKKKPAVIETDTGDTIGIRHFMFLSHSYDHRVVDGSLGGMVVRRVGDYLEQWNVERSI